MPGFSKLSRSRLMTCHPDLITIAETAIKYYDFSVICGKREKIEQEAAYKKGYSKLHYPDSRHNQSVIMKDDSISDAMDLAPYSNKLKAVDWDNLEAFRFLGGLIIGISEMLYSEGKIHHRVRWGGDWNGYKDYYNDFKDQKFIDLPHFELIP